VCEKLCSKIRGPFFDFLTATVKKQQQHKKARKSTRAMQNETMAEENQKIGSKKKGLDVVVVFN
jgi:hypothetical protein